MEDTGLYQMEVKNEDLFWLDFYNVIQKVSKEFDEQWQVRKRLLDTNFLVFFILKLLLSKNKQGYTSILCELWDSSQKNISLPKETPIAASSVCEARQKMPETIFLELNKAILAKGQLAKSSLNWHNHRIFAVDGCRINVPRELIDNGYKKLNKSHYPTGLISCLYHLEEEIIYDFNFNSLLSERESLFEHIEHLSLGDVLVLDRGYFSCMLLYKCLEKKIDVVCRIQSGSINKTMQNFLDSQETDQIIQYYPSESVKYDLKRRKINLEYKVIPLRMFKYTIKDETYLFATTLLDKKYTINDFSKLYHARWGIEELYKISKQFIEVEDFHSKSERGVKQEIYAHLFLINIARIFEAKAKNNLPPPKLNGNEQIKQENTYWQSFCDECKEIKINFKNCLLVIGRYIEQLFFNCKFITDWLPNMLYSISRVRQKIRPGRHYCRQSYKPVKKWAISISNKKKN